MNIELREKLMIIVYGILFVMENYEEIIEQIRQIDPDIAILDINMGNNPKSGINDK